MALNALDEKINKIKLKNEEIKRRHEEVEADKKNAAKLNALVQLVPSDNWPERKEPPEFSAPSKNINSVNHKQKISNKEQNDRLPQRYSGVQDRLTKKEHKFTQGDGPPPDPKYNFLADSEREIRNSNNVKTDDDKNRSRNKSARGASRKRGGGGEGRGNGGGCRDAFFKDNRGPNAFYSHGEALPEYEAWRAERNKIDEARINRQKTAEGNWRREWDCNKVNVEKDSSRKGDFTWKDSNNYERRSNHFENEYSNRGHGGNRTYHGSHKNHGQDYRRTYHDQPLEHNKRELDNKPPLSPIDDRTVTATDQSIKVTLCHGNQPKGPVMSVKVNSPSIAGTGRVGPRQKSRVTYSSQSDTDVINQEIKDFSRQKSFDEKTAASIFNSSQKPAPKSPFLQRRKENNSKSPHPQRKEFKNSETSSTRSKNLSKSLHSQKNEPRDKKQPVYSTPKSQRAQKRIQKIDNAENVFILDDAIPCEYNPDKPLQSENLGEQKLIHENYNSEKNFNKSIELDEGFLDTSKNSSDSMTGLEHSNESLCNKNLETLNESAIEKPQEMVEISQDNSEGKTTEKLLAISEQEIIENVVQKNDICISNQEQFSEKILVSNEEILISNSKNAEELVLDTELENNINIIEMKGKTDLSIDKVDNEISQIPEIVEQEIQELTSEKSYVNEMTEEYGGNILKESMNNKSNKMDIDEITNSESAEVAECIINESAYMEEQKTSELDILKNEISIDSGFKDSEILSNSIEINKTILSEIDLDQSVNDFDPPIHKLNVENIDENNSQGSVETDIHFQTKEICEESSKICDIHSAEFVNDVSNTNKDRQEVPKVLDTSTKDGDNTIGNNNNENLEQSKLVELQKVTTDESMKTIENPLKEESTKTEDKETVEK